MHTLLEQQHPLSRFCGFLLSSFVLSRSSSQMAFGQVLLLSDLNTSLRRVTVRARVARVWEFHKDNQLAHVDIIFVDEKGNQMYGEIQAMHAEIFIEKLKEGNVCLIKDFFVNTTKNKYKVVEGSFMIKITPWSKVEVQQDVREDYPHYAYSLTGFKLLPSMVGKTDSFIDVIGILSAISDLLKVRLPRRGQDSHKRNLHITDIDGNIMDVALWGDHATAFQADDLYDRGQRKPIIMLFLGTLMKSYLGRPTISCSDAAKIYINPEIYEKMEYCDRLTSANDDQYNAAYNRDDPETVDVAFLNSSDPNEFLGKNMKSTVTIMRLASEHSWFLSCQLCHKKAFQATNAFVCSNKRCNCTTATPRYKVRVIGADKTREVEFVFFATVAEQIIGKWLEVVMHNARPSIVPVEISALISQKLTFNYTVNERGLQYGQLSFQVNSVTATHKKTIFLNSTNLALDQVAHQLKNLEKIARYAEKNATQIDGSKENDRNEMQTAAIVSDSPELNATDCNRHSKDFYLEEETAP
ncbi:hypothetical protein D1007_10530 [Hordeum vulgare]|nr:hypothetical protein D1007_10530 [Hordeum vulgare]